MARSEPGMPPGLRILKLYSDPGQAAKMEEAAATESR